MPRRTSSHEIGYVVSTISETEFSGTYGDRGTFIFPVQLTTSRIGSLTRRIHTLLYVMIILYILLGKKNTDHLTADYLV